MVAAVVFGVPGNNPICALLPDAELAIARCFGAASIIGVFALQPDLILFFEVVDSIRLTIEDVAAVFGIEVEVVSTIVVIALDAEVGGVTIKLIYALAAV